MLTLVFLSPIIGIVGLGVAFVLFSGIMKQSPGNERMIEISQMIHEGAMTFLKREYTILAGFVAIVFALCALF